MVDLYADLSTLSDEELQQALAASPGDPALPRELTMRRVAKLLPGAPRGLLQALWCSSNKPWLEPASLPAPWVRVTQDLGRRISEAGAQKGLEQLRPDLPLGGQTVLNAAIAAARKISGADRLENVGVAFAIEGLRVLEEECRRKGVPLTDELCRERLGVGLKKYGAAVDLCEAMGIQHPDDYRRLVEADQVVRDRLRHTSNIDYLNWSAGLVPLVSWMPELGHYHCDGTPQVSPDNVDPEEHAAEVIKVINASRRAGVMPLALEQEEEIQETIARTGVKPPDYPQQRADGSWFCPNGGQVVWDEVPNMVRRKSGTRVVRERQEVAAVRREVDRDGAAALADQGLKATSEALAAYRIERLKKDPELADRLWVTVEREVDVFEEVADGTRSKPRCARTIESIAKVKDWVKENPEELRRMAAVAFGRDEDSGEMPKSSG